MKIITITKQYHITIQSIQSTEEATERIKKLYNVENLEQLGNFTNNEIIASGILLKYIEITQIGKINLK